MTKGARFRRAGPSGHGERARRAVLFAFLAIAPPLSAQDTATIRTVLRAAIVLDGRGGAWHNMDILVVGNRIASITTRRAVPAGGRARAFCGRPPLPAPLLAD